MNIYVGNVNYRVDENELTEAFTKYGQVTEIKIIKDQESGQSRGFGFITMSNDQEAERAITELNGFVLQGKTLTVNRARSRN